MRKELTYKLLGKSGGSTYGNLMQGEHIIACSVPEVIGEELAKAFNEKIRRDDVLNKIRRAKNQRELNKV